MAKTNDLISIITPVYNDQNWLADCVKSIRAQTYQHWELLLIDDDSTDQATRLALRWQAKDHRIHYYHQAHQGVGAARNAGLQLARGGLVAFIDGDDWVEPNYLATLLQDLQAHDADVAVVNFIEYDQLHRGYLSHLFNSDAEYKLVGCYRPQEWLAKEGTTTAELSFVFDVSYCKLFKKKLFEGVTYPNQIPEDDRTNWKAYAAANRIYYRHWPGYIYRINKSGSLSMPQNRALFFHPEPTEAQFTTYRLSGIPTANLARKYHKRLNYLANCEPSSNKELFHYLDARFKLKMLGK